MQTPGKHSRRIVALEREQRALELRKAGATYQQIADAMGLSTMGAYNAVKRAIGKLNNKITEDAKAVRRLELERLNQAQLAIWPRVQKGDIKAINALLRIMERRAKLLGLDAPAEANVNVTEQVDLSKGITRENVHQVAARLMTVLREVEESTE